MKIILVFVGLGGKVCLSTKGLDFLYFKYGFGFEWTKLRDQSSLLMTSSTL